MGSDMNRPLHIVFFPLMAPGHMIPMLNLTELFASRGVTSTILITPASVPGADAARNRALSRGQPLHLYLLYSPEEPEPLPTLKSTTLSNQQNRLAFFLSLKNLRPYFETALRALLPIDAVVSDMFFPWTVESAKELGIPRLVFHGCGLFALCATGAAELHNLHDSTDETVAFPPDFPHPIQMLRTQLADPRRLPPSLVELLADLRAADARSYGVVVNSFHEMEGRCRNYYRDALGCKNWLIGPVSLYNSGKSMERHYSLDWLDSKRPRSVVYICFGSMTHVEAVQLREIALFLLHTEHPFIWVVKDSWSLDDGEVQTVELQKKGLVIRGWAPQVEILNHEAVGAFVTHCGWNSCMEGLCAGVPMVTWPGFADQFFNEKLLVDLLKVGVAVGVKEMAARDVERAVVREEEIRKAVDSVMDVGDEAVRMRVAELSVIGKHAMEPGGSSYDDLSRLLEELIYGAK